MKNLYFISFLFLIGCGSSSGFTTCHDCDLTETGGTGMGGEFDNTGGSTETGGNNSQTGGNSTGGNFTGGNSTGGSNTCVPTNTCSDGQVGSACGKIDDGCGNIITCGCVTDSVCGGENSKKITHISPTYSSADYTVSGTENICSNTCVQQLQTIVIENFCGTGTTNTLWTCPNFYVFNIPQMLQQKNCIDSSSEPNVGAFCCD